MIPLLMYTLPSSNNEKHLASLVLFVVSPTFLHSPPNYVEVHP